MPLYDLDDNQVKFIKSVVTSVLPQGGTREDARKFIEMGDTCLVQLNKPIHPIGKPKLIKETEPGCLTPEERKVINEL